MSGGTGTDGLVFRQDYFDDPAGWRAICDLLMDVFGVDITPLDRLGGHDRSNMPSAFFDADGRCVANFSAFAMPVIVGGRRVNAAAWQSGAVREEYRGRGLFRELIRITLDRCEAAGFEAIVLYTDKPGLYEPYGFRAFCEQSFAGPTPLSGGKASPVRRLSVENPDDLALLRAALAGRSPVSRRIAVCDQALMFLLNAWLVDDVTLTWLEEARAAIAWRIGETGDFELLDIVAADIPPLADIVASLGIAAPRAIVHFPPDLIAWPGEALEPEGELVFMMRAAPELMPRGPFRLSPMAEF